MKAKVLVSLHTSYKSTKNGLIADSFDVYNGDPQVDFALMSFDMHHLVNNTYGDDNEGDDDDVEEDVEDVIDKSIAAVKEKEENDGEDVTSKMQEMIPGHVEWGTCPL